MPDSERSQLDSFLGGQTAPTAPAAVEPPPTQPAAPAPARQQPAPVAPGAQQPASSVPPAVEPGPAIDAGLLSMAETVGLSRAEVAELGTPKAVMAAINWAIKRERLRGSAGGGVPEGALPATQPTPTAPTFADVDIAALEAAQYDPQLIAVARNNAALVAERKALLDRLEAMERHMPHILAEVEEAITSRSNRVVDESAGELGIDPSVLRQPDNARRLIAHFEAAMNVFTQTGQQAPPRKELFKQIVTMLGFTTKSAAPPQTPAQAPQNTPMVEPEPRRRFTGAPTHRVNPPTNGTPTRDLFHDRGADPGPVDTNASELADFRKSLLPG